MLYPDDVNTYGLALLLEDWLLTRFHPNIELAERDEGNAREELFQGLLNFEQLLRGKPYLLGLSHTSVDILLYAMVKNPESGELREVIHLPGELEDWYEAMHKRFGVDPTRT